MSEPKGKPTIKEVISEEFKFDRKTFFKDLIDLKKGVSYKATIKEIKSKISMNGANAWMLFASIMIASIGLNLNSQAVIIGAMLISPLMSPILGIGLGIGINDRNLLIKALIHFSAAVIIAIIASTVYFSLSPLSNYTEQIQARTEPTLLDILIAFFGGVAGIVSIVRKDISTTIPGVAIATALMPPLCVTGYGIAEGSLAIASKSFYLFFLNTFFVSFATYLIIRYLKFPYRKFLNPNERKKTLTIIGFFSIAMIIPSFFIFQDVLHKAQQESAINELINEGLGDKKIFLDDYGILNYGDTQKLALKVYGTAISDKDIPRFKELLAPTVLNGMEIDIIPTSEININQIQKLEDEITQVGSIANELKGVQKEKEEQEVLIQELTKDLKTNQMDSTQFVELCKELKLIYPELQKVEFSKGQVTDFENYNENLPSFYTNWAEEAKELELKKQRLQLFLKERLEWDTLRVIAY